MAPQTLRSPLRRGCCCGLAHPVPCLPRRRTTGSPSVDERLNPPSLAGFTDPPVSCPYRRSRSRPNACWTAASANLRPHQAGRLRLRWLQRRRLLEPVEDPRLRSGQPLQPSARGSLAISRDSPLAGQQVGGRGPQAHRAYRPAPARPQWLVNLVVKRPLDDDATQVFLAAEQPGTLWLRSTHRSASAPARVWPACEPGSRRVLTPACATPARRTRSSAADLCVFERDPARR